MGFFQRRLNPRALAMYVFVLVLVWASRPGLMSTLIGSVIVALGVGIRFWATGYLVKTQELAIQGPYAYVRHPLYLGTALVATGCAAVANHPVGWLVWLGLVALFYIYYLPYKNRIEGARLEARFGDDYRRYEVIVPRLLPRIHPYRPLGGTATVERWSAERVVANNEVSTLLWVLTLVSLMVLRWALL